MPPVGFEPTTPAGERLPGLAYFLVLVVNDLISGNQWSMLSNSDLMPANLSATAHAFPSHNPYAKMSVCVLVICRLSIYHCLRLPICNLRMEMLKYIKQLFYPFLYMGIKLILRYYVKNTG